MGREKGPRALSQAWLIVLAACTQADATPPGFLAHQNFEGSGSDRKRVEATFTKLDGSIEFVVRAEVFAKSTANPFAAVSVEMRRNDHGAKVACVIEPPKHRIGSINENGTSRGEEYLVPIKCSYDWRGACRHATDSGVPVELRVDGTIERP